MNKTYLITALIFQFLILNGCVNQKYTPFIQCELQPTEVKDVKIITGNTGNAIAIAEKSRLPHLSKKEQFTLWEDAVNEYRKQLGSNDYILVGEMFVGGNAYSSMASVKKTIAERVAKEGGDVVLIFNSGVEKQAYTWTSPGNSTSKTDIAASGSTRGDSIYLTGQATTKTTYTPAQTTSGVYHKPYIEGVIFKYRQGREDIYKKILSLTDEQFEAYLVHFHYTDDSCEFLWGEIEKYMDNVLKN